MNLIATALGIGLLTPQGPPDRTRLFALLDRLEMPISAARFIQMRTTSLPAKKGESWIDYGFLVSKTSKKVRYIDAVGMEGAAELSEADKKTVVSKGDPRKYLEEELELAAVRKYMAPSEIVIMGKLARECHLKALEDQLFSYAASSLKDEPPGTDLEKAVLSDLENASYSAIHTSIKDGDSWRVVRRRLEAHVRLFPNDKRTETHIRPYLESVRRMEHQVRPAGEIEGMIFDLRENPSTDKLVAAGLRAVPALIEAMTDRTVTREVDQSGFAEEWHSWVVFPVSHLASFALEDIVFHDFYFDAQRQQDEFLFSLSLSERMQRSARAWWAKNGNKSELEILTLALMEPYILPSAIEVLVKRYPKEAFGILKKSIESHPGGSADYLVSYIGNLKDPAAKNYVRAAISKGSLTARLDAIEALAKEDPEAALKALLREWVALKDLPFYAVSDPVEIVVIRLLQTQRAEAVAAIRVDIAHRPIDTRRIILRHLPSRWEKVPNEEATVFKAFQPEVERLLILMLDDQSPRRPLSQPDELFDGKVRLKSPRLCDQAAECLGTLFPTKYRFELKASRDEMNVLIEKFRKIAGSL